MMHEPLQILDEATNKVEALNKAEAFSEENHI